MRFLPAWSPDFHPIEKRWSKVKALLRSAEARALMKSTRPSVPPSPRPHVRRLRLASVAFEHRPVALDLGLEVSQAVPVRVFVEIDLRDGHRAEVISLRDHVAVVVKDA